MKTIKNKLFLATAILALASCADNTYIGDQDINTPGNGGAILFDMSTPAITRGTSADATKLDNQFIVWGEKNESGGAAVAIPSANSVFPNYQVNWVDNAQSTTSNTSGWEYVGYTHSHTASTDDYQTNISPSLSVAQEIKYWDMSATNYVFTAVSALKNDIKTGKIKITKTNTAVGNVYLKGYQIVATADADFTHLYFADRNVISSNYGTSPVTMNFRNLLSHIRVGIYETIPGYEVTAIKFYSADITDGNEFKENSTSCFGATVDNQKPGANTLTVTYNDGSVNSTLLNRPIVSTSGTKATTITLGQNFNTLSTSNVMGTSSTVPTWETSSGAFTKVFPREETMTDMTLRVKYTLYNSASGETMNVTGTAVVPGKYLQWKPNFKYTYIFKLTDEALSPITFDAITIDDGEGNQQTITTVDNPSITTYQKGAIVNEYSAGNIYVVVGEGTALTVGTNAKLYTAATTGSYTGGITEASVANALKNGTMNNNTTPTTWTVTDASSNTLTISSAAGLTAFTEIPNTDSPTGVALTINGAKFSATANTTYVFEYIIPTYTQASGTYVANTKYYTDNTGATEVDTSGFTAGTTDVSSYFVANYSTPASKHYKVIKVAASN